jgi:hypothetical protein
MILRSEPRCVKISRIMREFHALAEKLFTKKWQVAGDKMKSRRAGSFPVIHNPSPVTFPPS